jgi:hypothetical protein
VEKIAEVLAQVLCEKDAQLAWRGDVSVGEQ